MHISLPANKLKELEEVFHKWLVDLLRVGVFHAVCYRLVGFNQALLQLH